MRGRGMGGRRATGDCSSSRVTWLAARTKATSSVQRTSLTLGGGLEVAGITSSNTGGNTWSPPINLTDTKSPECTSRHTDSVCSSEAWATIARDISDINITYIRYFEAGYFGEAPWSMNRFMYLSFPGGGTDAEYVCPIIAPNFASYISVEAEC